MPRVPIDELQVGVTMGRSMLNAAGYGSWVSQETLTICVEKILLAVDAYRTSREFDCKRSLAQEITSALGGKHASI